MNPLHAFALGLLFLAGISPSGTTAWRPDMLAVQALEKHLQMPGGAHRLNNYIRYYAGTAKDGVHTIYGIYLLKQIVDGSNQIQMRGHGAVRIIDSVDELPGISDGGCSQLTVLWDGHGPAKPFCNGVA